MKMNPNPAGASRVPALLYATTGLQPCGAAVRPRARLPRHDNPRARCAGRYQDAVPQCADDDWPPTTTGKGRSSRPLRTACRLFLTWPAASNVTTRGHRRRRHPVDSSSWNDGSTCSVFCLPDRARSAGYCTRVAPAVVYIGLVRLCVPDTDREIRGSFHRQGTAVRPADGPRSSLRSALPKAFRPLPRSTGEPSRRWAGSPASIECRSSSPKIDHIQHRWPT
jgi:hypothetical protein